MEKVELTISWRYLSQSSRPRCLASEVAASECQKEINLFINTPQINRVRVPIHCVVGSSEGWLQWLVEGQ